MTFMFTFFPQWLTQLEKRLSTNGNPLFFAADQLTIADFMVGSVLFSAVYNDANPKAALLKSTFDTFPLLKAYAENLQTNVFKEYLEKRPKREF